MHHFEMHMADLLINSANEMEFYPELQQEYEDNAGDSPTTRANRMELKKQMGEWVEELQNGAHKSARMVFQGIYDDMWMKVKEVYEKFISKWTQRNQVQSAISKILEIRKRKLDNPPTPPDTISRKMQISPDYEGTRLPNPLHKTPRQLRKGGPKDDADRTVTSMNFKLPGPIRTTQETNSMWNQEQTVLEDITLRDGGEHPVMGKGVYITTQSEDNNRLPERT